MSFLEMLNAIFLDPVISLLEILFYFGNFVSHDVFLTISIVAIFANFMFLPISKHAATYNEKVYQNAFNTKCKKISERAVFSSDAKTKISYFVLNLFKVMFFIASLEFFSELAMLEDVESGFLASADGLLKIGDIKFNLLPILMVMINIVLFVLTYKTTSQKAKIEQYLVTAVLFIMLYNASAGIVLFWIVTNAFYLLAYLCRRYKVIRKNFKYILSGVGFVFAILCICRKYLLFIVLGGLLQLPTLYHVISSPLKKHRKPKANKKPIVYKNSKIQYFVEAALIIFLLGLFIPSTYVAASPQEYISSALFFSPLNYVLGSFLTAFGYMMVWVYVMYAFASEKNKYRLNKLLMISTAVMLVDYMFFGLNLGTISFSLKYDFGFNVTVFEAIINAVVIVAIIVVFSLAYAKLKEYLSIILSLIIVVLSVMSTFNIITSVSQIKDYKNGVIAKSKLNYNLSTTGNNVVVIMLDRALGQYVPYIFNERPELAEKFEGFTHYQNTISFGFFTNFATPALLGGYEYTPVELNKRDGELLKDKNNESNLVMPRIFADAGYNVTVADPIYINYKYVTDLSMFNDYKNTNAFYTIGKFVADDQVKFIYKLNMTNFFRFSFMKSLPLALQYIFYDEGNYNNVQSKEELQMYGNQITDGVSKATGISNVFMNNYLTLKNMSTMTSITSDETNTFLFLRNDTTHEPMLLDEANNYTPNYIIDNTEYDANNADRFVLPNGQKLKVNDKLQMMHYHINMAALIELGNWFDYLRENGTYDNTKIILVSDHGRDMHSVSGMYCGGKNLEMCAPLLMVKDFKGSSDYRAGFTTSMEFMTNADVPALATRHFPVAPKNPFTNKEINMSEKYAHPQYITTSEEWNIFENKGKTFLPSTWLEFDSTKPDCNIYDSDCWSHLNKNTVLKTHSFN